METEELSFKAFRDARKAVASVIIENLEYYRRLGPMSNTFGTHGVQGHIVPMGNANYLRYLAYASQHHNTSTHFLSESDIQKEGLQIKEGAEPLIIERWTVDAQKNYHCFNYPVYSISDLNGPEKVLDAYRKNLPQPFRTSREVIRRFLEEEEVLPKDTMPQANLLEQGIRAYAAKAAPDTLREQRHLAYLLLLTADLRPDNTTSPLYTEEDIQRLKDAPSLLFASFSAASKKMKSIRERLRFLERQIEQEKEERVHQLVEEEKTHPLASLRITYHWSEAPNVFTDKDGKPLPMDEGFELTGEDAYRFLVQANLADKKNFHSTGGYYKTKFTLAYGNTELGTDRYDLGDPCFDNQKSIAKAMEAHMTEPYQYYLDNDDKLRQHFSVMQQFNGEELRGDPDYATPEAYRAKLQKNVDEIHQFWQDFSKQEQAFLQEHPEYEKMNQEDAGLYIAMCPISEYEVAKASGMVMETIPKDELHDFVTCEPSAWKVHQAVMIITKDAVKENDQLKRYSGYAENPSIPEGFIAFKTAISPASIIWDNRRDAEKYPVGLSYVIPKEQIEKLQCLEDISLTWGSYKPAIEQPSEYPPQTSTSLHALKNFEIAVNHDDQIYKEALSKRVYVPGTCSQNELTVSVKGKPIYQISYRNGRGELAKASPNYLSPKLPEHYKEAVEIYQRYESDSNRVLGQDRTYASTPNADRPFPTVEESYTNFEKHYSKKPEKTSRLTREWREDAIQYYVTHPLVDPAIDTPKKAVLATISEMAKDGYTEARIKSVLENNGTTRHREEAVALLKSPEGKKAIRQARKERDEAEAIHKTADKAH